MVHAFSWTRVHLAILLQCVATCCELKIELGRMPGRNIVARPWPNGYNIIQHPQMLHEKSDHFQIWANNKQHIATRRNRVAKRTQHVARSNVALKCCDRLAGALGVSLGCFVLVPIGIIRPLNTTLCEYHITERRPVYSGLIFLNILLKITCDIFLYSLAL